MRVAKPTSLIVSFLFLLPLIAFAGKRTNSSFTESTYDITINRCAQVYSLHPDLIKAVIWRESRFNPKAVGKAGEVGLMQLTKPATKDWAKAHKRRVPLRYELFNPHLNIVIGSWYLARARNHWRNYYRQCQILALCEYNAGRNGMKSCVTVEKNGKVIIHRKQLHNYIKTIIERYSVYLAKRHTRKKQIMVTDNSF